MAKQKLTDPFIRNYPRPQKRIEIYDTLVNGLAIRISSTGHKSFVYRYRFGKTVKRYTIGRFPAVRLSTAREQARELTWKVTNGVDPMQEKKNRKQPVQKFMFENLSKQYIKRHIPQLSQSTKKEYKRIIKKELKPTFGQLPVEEITRKQIIDLLDTIAIDRSTPVYSNRVRAVLSSMFTFGIDKAMLESNPVLTVRRKRKRKNGEPVERKRKRTYTIEEIRKLWQAFLIQKEPVRSIFLMLLICGQRSGVTRRMKWKHINLGDKIWKIPKEETKAKRTHVVPLSDLAMEVLNSISKYTDQEIYVFPSHTRNNQPIRWLQKASDRVKEITGITDFRIHDLRRTAATFMAELGTERTVLGKVLNHKELAGDRQVTAIYDRHKYLDQKQKALQKWSDHLKQILDGKLELNV